MFKTYVYTQFSWMIKLTLFNFKLFCCFVFICFSYSLFLHWKSLYILIQSDTTIYQIFITIYSDKCNIHINGMRWLDDFNWFPIKLSLVQYESSDSLTKTDQKSHSFSNFNITCNDFKKHIIHQLWRLASFHLRESLVASQFGGFIHSSFIIFSVIIFFTFVHSPIILCRHCNLQNRISKKLICMELIQFYYVMQDKK